jgi:hypothetical protein
MAKKAINGGSDKVDEKVSGSSPYSEGVAVQAISTTVPVKLKGSK